MGSFQNPVGSGPRDPFDKTFRIEPVEEDKLTRREKQKEIEDIPPNDKLSAASFLLQLFKGVVDFILKKSPSNRATPLTPRGSLLLLKSLLETLKKEDRSQDVAFLNELSRVWHYAIENAIHFKNDTAVAEFRALIKKIQHYPETQTHTFGYYLTENVNQKWVPFPYMELIQKIHAEHQKNSDSSSLTQWTNLIDELLSLLKDE